MWPWTRAIRYPIGFTLFGIAVIFAIVVIWPCELILEYEEKVKEKFSKFWIWWMQ